MDNRSMANRVLLGILLLCNSFSVYEVICLQHLPRVKEYEVVYPQKLDARHRRNAANSTAKFPDEVKYGFKLHGQDLVMHLQRNEYLFDKNYTETTFSPDGQPEITNPDVSDHCYYQGYMRNESASEASISICDGLRGYFKIKGQGYLIEPLGVTEHEKHAVYKIEDQKSDYQTCGVIDNTTWSRTPTYVYEATDAEKQAFLKGQKYIKMVIVTDVSMYNKYGKSIQNIRKRLFEIINRSNLIYKVFNVFVALIGIEVWTTKDEIEVNHKFKILLGTFAAWRQNFLLPRMPNDNANFLTAVDFEGGAYGLAYTGNMCSDYHSATVLTDRGSSNRVAVTLTHEVGHLLGMNHDGPSCSCPSGRCIMYEAISVWSELTEFSSCSKEQFNNFINSMPGCMMIKPLMKDLKTPPVCGNAFPEGGEDCDCGTPQDCKNPCCEASKCKFKSNAVCAEGDCCQNCQFKGNGVICRPSKDDCDLPERCSGKGSLCQSDRFRSNGIPCKNNEGYCFNGDCPTLKKQCEDSYGTGAAVAEHCFRKNTESAYYGFCKYSKGKYIGCAQKDIKCGHLWCSGGGSGLTFEAAVVKFSTCSTITPRGGFVEGYGMTKSGTKCGDGLVCHKNECLDVKGVYKIEECIKRCKGHGECDHENRCRCEPGWEGPDCKAESSAGKIMLAGYIILIPVVVIRDFYQQIL